MMNVRYGQLDDTERIMALLSKVWADDYVPHLWTEWVQQPECGIVLVAECEGSIVGTCYVDFMANDTCWFQAMRVHPGYRRLGVGTELTKVCLQEAKARGKHAAYLGIEADNSASANMTIKQGFVKLLDFRRLITKLPPCEILSPRQTMWRQATEGDIAAMLRICNTTMAPGPIFACWQWEPLSHDALERNIRHETLWVWGSLGEIRVWAGFENHKPEYHLFSPSGAVQDIKAALDDLLDFIQGPDEVALKFWIHNESPVITYLKTIGFIEEDGYTIWEYNLNSQLIAH
ncbi:MAG: GNAT family N-acetyltransferase [Peptococcaceae bacterium]|nr:GNAT family N-acetyltransferase [Peptococcaceae bacterium]